MSLSNPLYGLTQMCWLLHLILFIILFFQHGGKGRVAALNSTATPTSGCDPGWSLYESYCYSIGDGADTAKNGKRYCKTYSALLVTVSDEAENSYLINQFGGVDLWLSLTDDKTEGEWLWAGDQSDYTNWAPGEPNGGTDENCAMLNGTSGMWSSEDCNLDLEYACERHVDVTLAPSTSPTFSPTASQSQSQSISTVQTQISSPTKVPTLPPTEIPSTTPTEPPTHSPSLDPTLTQSQAPTLSPTLIPTLSPTQFPSQFPTLPPSQFPTQTPTLSRSPYPTQSPTLSPTFSPTLPPTVAAIPTLSPTQLPSHFPTSPPSQPPTQAPTPNPTQSPTLSPTFSPTLPPTQALTPPSQYSSINPSAMPSRPPTFKPTSTSTASSSIPPTAMLSPTPLQTRFSTFSPSLSLLPTSSPSQVPTQVPMQVPTLSPTQLPILTPTLFPTQIPSLSPTKSLSPTVQIPTQSPTLTPTLSPTQVPSLSLTTVSPTFDISTQPATQTSTLSPTQTPSLAPTTTYFPTVEIRTQPPTLNPTLSPSQVPSLSPTTIVSTVFKATLHPTVSGSFATSSPSLLETTQASTFSKTLSSSPSGTLSSTLFQTLTFASQPSSLFTLTSPPTFSPMLTQPPTSKAFQSTPSPSITPSLMPTLLTHSLPTSFPTFIPSKSNTPTLFPTLQINTALPSFQVSPTLVATVPTQSASTVSSFPSFLLSLSQTPVTSSTLFHTPQPTFGPSLDFPSESPSIMPSVQPSSTTANISNPQAPSVILDYFERIGKHENLSVDASLSTGALGQRLSFHWELVSPSCNMTEITSYLASVTGYQINVLNALLKPRQSYLVKATATNVANLSTSAFANVTLQPTVVPLVKISGVTEIYRNQRLYLIAEHIEGTGCSNETLDDDWTFEWSIEGHSEFRSLSHAPHHLILSPFALAEDVYTVRVNIMDGVGRKNWAHHRLVVSKGALVARISGGSYQVVSVEDHFVLSGNSSYDENNADGSLSTNASVGWSCFVEGISCGLQLDTASFNLNIPPNTLTLESMYVFTMTLFDGERSSQATTAVSTIQEDVPRVSILSSASTINSGDKLSMAGVTSQTTASGSSSWSVVLPTDLFVSADNLEGASGTDLSQDFPSGATSSHYLVVLPSELVAGTSYVFQFAAAYEGGAAESFAQVEVVINTPPTAGSFTVKPESGSSVLDFFYLKALYFDDVDENLPLLFMFLYSRKGESISQLLQSDPNTLNYKSEVILPQGLLNFNYTVDCGVTVSNRLGAEVTMWSGVTVTPYPANLADAITDTTTLVSEYMHSFDLDKIYMLFGAIGQYLGKVNCSLAPDCSMLNRMDCEFGNVDHMCGECMEGYTGSVVDPTVPCLASTGNCSNGVFDAIMETDVDCGGSCAPCSQGQACFADSDCIQGLCEAGLCGLSAKPCPNLCSGVGICTHYDSNGYAISSAECLVGDLYCTAECSCIAGFEGSSCQYSVHQYEELQQLLKLLAQSLATTLHFNDGLFTETQQVIDSVFEAATRSGEKMRNVTERMFLNVTSWAAKKAATNGILSESSNKWLQTLTILPSDIDVNSFLSSLDDMATALAFDLVPGEDSVAIVSEQIRLVAGVYDLGNGVSSIDLPLPLTKVETDALRSTSTLRLNTEGFELDEMEFSASSLLNNPHDSNGEGGVLDNLAEFIQFRMPNFGTSSAITEVNIEVELENLYATEFKLGSQSTVIGYCLDGEYSTKQLVCEDVSLTFECLGSVKTVNASCTASKKLPRCVQWDGLTWSNNDCQVTFHNSTRTVCNCSISMAGQRRLTEDETHRYEITSTSTKIAAEITENIQSVNQLSLSSVEKNLVVFVTMGVFLCLLPLVALVSTCSKQRWKWQLPKNVDPDSSIWAKLKVEGTDEVHEVLPHFWDRRPGFSAFTDTFASENIWLNLLKCNAEVQEKLNQTAKLVVVGLTFMFWDATLFGMMFPPTDDTFCQQWLDQENCNRNSGSYCHWDLEDQICHAYEFEETFETVVYITVLSTLLTLPIMVVMSIIMRRTILLQLPDAPDNSTGDSDHTSSDANHHLLRNEPSKYSQPLSGTDGDFVSVEVQQPTNVNQNQSDVEPECSNNHPWYEVLMHYFSVFLRQSNSSQPSRQAFETVLFNLKVKEERDLFERDLAAKEGPYLWRQWIPTAISEPVIMHCIRKHVKRANEIEVILQDKELRTTVAEKEVFLLRVAEIDCLNLFEYQASKRLLFHLDKGKRAQRRLSLTSDAILGKQHTYSRRSVIRLYALGWTVVSGYCCIVAFYICLFGINYGAEYTNAWLSSFVLGILEDVAVIQPLKLLFIYILLPLIAPGKFRIDRIKNLPSYASSAQIARKHSELISSQLILLRSSASVPEKIKNYVHVPAQGTDKIKKVVNTILLYVAVGGAVVVMPLLPEPFQEAVLEAWVLGLSNLLLVTFYWFYELSAPVFACFLIFIIFLIIYGVYRAINHYQDTAVSLKSALAGMRQRNSARLRSVRSSIASVLSGRLSKMDFEGGDAPPEHSGSPQRRDYSKPKMKLTGSAELKRHEKGQLLSLSDFALEDSRANLREIDLSNVTEIPTRGKSLLPRETSTSSPLKREYCKPPQRRSLGSSDGKASQVSLPQPPNGITPPKRRQYSGPPPRLLADQSGSVGTSGLDVSHKEDSMKHGTTLPRHGITPPLRERSTQPYQTSQPDSMRKLDTSLESSDDEQKPGYDKDTVSPDSSYPIEDQILPRGAVTSPSRRGYSKAPSKAETSTSRLSLSKSSSKSTSMKQGFEIQKRHDPPFDI